MKKLKKWLLPAAGVVLAAAVALTAYLIWGNCAVTVSEYTVTDAEIPAAFGGFRIVQVSDLHNTEFGKGNRRLLEKIKAAEPDIIVLTGDLLDFYHTDVEVAADFARDVVQIAPTYFVTGNHEHRLEEYALLKVQMEAAGVQVMENETALLERDGESITLLGVQDPTFLPGWTREKEKQLLADAVAALTPEAGYSILLCHRPNYLADYAACGVDLAFAGHFHGGQFRVPFLGGLYSPTYGFFPDYDAGVWTEGDTTLIISRGLGNSAFPLRLNNPPDLVVAELNCA